MQGSIAALYCVVRQCTVLYCTVLKSKIQYSIVQYRSQSTEIYLLLSSAHPLQERFELHESLLVLWLAQLLHESLGLLLGELLSKVCEKTEEFVSNHGVVSIFVVELQDLNEVVEATLVLGVLAGLVHGEDVSFSKELGSLGLSTTDLIDGLQGGVEVTGADEVTGIEGIDLAVTLEVVDVKGELDRVNFLLLKSELSHFVLCDYGVLPQ